ncbi:hypothetical protein DFH11DRAFT_678844 [Phellopilus nigrolimitatus]|nr:hypothetical protein DFH11DRAFT_678844 [Phellopilus nigrolimitatus]
MFGRSSRHHTTGTSNRATGSRRNFFHREDRGHRETASGSTGSRRGLFHRADPDRQAGGYKAALHNPNTTHEGRRHAKHELREMGRGREAHGHPSLKSRIRHMFGMHSRSSRSTARSEPVYSERC